MKKRWLGLVYGLVAFGAFGFGIHALRERGIKLPADAANRAHHILKKGTPIDLVLMESLSSGGTSVGAPVKLCLFHDLEAGGDVLVERGSAASAMIVESRGANMFSGFMLNKPARLAMEWGSLTLPDGRKVSLMAAHGAKRLALEDKNTRNEATEGVDAAMADPKKREELVALSQKLLGEGKLPADLASYQQLSKDLGLKRTQELIDRGQGKAPSLGLSRSLEALNKGNIAALTGIDGILAAQALGELTSVATTVDRKLRDTFKGHNIRANIGLIMHAELGEDVEI